MKGFNARRRLAACAFVVACLSACASDEGTTGDVGEIGLNLQLAPRVTLDSVSWTVSNAGTGFSRSGTVNVRSSNGLTFQIGGLPTGGGYLITLSATSVDGSLSCLGSASFDVVAGTVSPVSVELDCVGARADAGSVVITGTAQVCANIDALDVAPLETSVNGNIALAATASAGAVTPTFAWSASAGSFDNAASKTPTFTCPPAAGSVTITLTVSPGSASCDTITSQSVTVTCGTLNPTFTNVYNSIISQRCVSCHRPGGGGFNVGRLDMSTADAAFANLVGVAAQGTGAGTSGVACGTAGLTRVVAGDAANSLIFNKTNSKLQGVLAPCGSPMPTPAGASPLTAGQVELIRNWITAGALND
jgi:hypothetical protein